MSELEVEHPSYPGYYAASLSEEAIGKLARVAQVMIPESTGFPDAGPLVPRFVAERIDPVEAEDLEQLLSGIQDTSTEAITTWIRGLESANPTQFAGLRSWVYYGYYGSGSVTDALRQAGSDYHGAPQPFGYHLDREAPLPRTPRGSYQETEEVRRVNG
jgi:hypothetical protein